MQAFPGTEFFAVGDDEGQLALLAEAARSAGLAVNALLDVNDGLNRTGVSTKAAGGLYRRAAAMPGLRMRGMHVYDGHRHEQALNERCALVAEDVRGVYALRDRLREEGYDCGIMVMGGTPSFPCHAMYEGVYLSPGTCLIQDYGYASAYKDLPFEIGAMLLSRVISHPAPAHSRWIWVQGRRADPSRPGR